MLRPGQGPGRWIPGSGRRQTGQEGERKWRVGIGEGAGLRTRPPLSLSLFPQQLHGLAGSVDLRLLRADAAGPGPSVLLGNELRHLQGLPDAVGHPRTVDDTGPPAVGEPCPGGPAGAAGPAAPASPRAPATSPPGHAHAAGRHPQPAAGDLPEFVCLVSACSWVPGCPGSLVFDKQARKIADRGCHCFTCQSPDRSPRKI